jgi:hypothetical protein
MSARFAFGAVVLLGLAGVYACVCGVAMTWDGSYQFAHTLIAQTPYYYGTRFHSFVFWQPLVLAERFTDNLTVLETLYGLPFALAPAAGLLLSWWVVRRHAPGLALWAVFGVAVAPLPGQVFLINDSIVQQHLFWPIFLALIVPGRLTRAQSVVLTALSAFQLSHPIGVVLALGGAGAAGLLAVGDSRHRRRYVVRSAMAAGLAALALAKLVKFPDAYAGQEFTWASASSHWHAGVSGWPLVGLAFMWAAGALALAPTGLHPREHARGRRLMMLAAGAVIVGCVVWAIWAADPRRWPWASEYRRWLVPLTVPFFAMAFVECWVRARRDGATDLPEPQRRSRGALALGLAGVFAVVFSVQSTAWRALTNRLASAVAAHDGPLLVGDDLAWARGTPLYHWSLPAYVVVVQGKRPSKFLALNATDEAALRTDPPAVPLAPGERRTPEPGPAGWFDFRPLVRGLSTSH